MTTIYTYEFDDGDKVQMSVNYTLLYKLKTLKPTAYENYWNASCDSKIDDFTYLSALYVAYLCANIENIDSCMEYEEFLTKCGINKAKVCTAYTELFLPKKNKNLEVPSDNELTK